MAAFDRIPSGIKGLDEALDSIRLGDNVVWQVSSLADFRPISDAFVSQSVADGRDVVYMRFASHPRLVARDTPGVKEVRLDPRKGFETFTMQVHRARGPRGLLRLRQPLRTCRARARLRLVMGLGTKAVNRTGRDYPRLVSLDRPTAATMTTDAERHRFSQRGCDLIDLASGTFEERPCEEAAALMPPAAAAAVMEHDFGVPMTFAETAPFAAIVKHVDAAHGFSPELSYGSHMFQGLVE